MKIRTEEQAFELTMRIYDQLARRKRAHIQKLRGYLEEQFFYDISEFNRLSDQRIYFYCYFINPRVGIATSDPGMQGGYFDFLTNDVILDETI